MVAISRGGKPRRQAVEVAADREAGTPATVVAVLAVSELPGPRSGARQRSCRRHQLHRPVRQWQVHCDARPERHEIELRKSRQSAQKRAQASASVDEASRIAPMGPSDISQPNLSRR
jgi:hypothetical protein